jgi:hypothetical protein
MTRVHWLAKWIDRDQLMFLERFQTILRAYQTGAMTYGCWVAHKPPVLSTIDARPTACQTSTTPTPA